MHIHSIIYWNKQPLQYRAVEELRSFLAFEVERIWLIMVRVLDWVTVAGCVVCWAPDMA